MMWILGAVVVALAAWRLDWRGLLADKGRQHLCFGAAMALVPLWMLQAGIRDGLEVHFLGLTTLALMLGWRMSQLMALLPLLLVTAFGIEVLARPCGQPGAGRDTALAVSYFVFLLTYSYLYRHLFVYIFVAGFSTRH
ncbi:energy-coupling factor ABC transporter permease [Oceanimonas sp. NS1]|nr:energy-coupling factor ABC transporter permease [Oceanimonas sp. NS1]